jgi:SP family myo-inositol transporter-like MFS transporter 13
VYGIGEGLESLVNGLLRKFERGILEEEVMAEGRAGPAAAKTGWSSTFSRINDTLTQLLAVGGNRRALIIACMLQGFQQLCGFVCFLPLFHFMTLTTRKNSLMYFSATIFRLVGFRSPTLTSLSIALTNFAFTLVAYYSIDRVGRRRILLWSVPIMIIGLALCSVAFGFVDLTGEEGASSVADRNKGWPLVILVAMVTYVAGYAIGLGNVPWQQSELFPLSVRSLGSAVSTATNWGCNTIIGLTFLPTMEFFTPVGTFALYAIVCAVCWGTVWKIYPETAGLGLEDVGGLLREGWSVKESVRGFESRRRGM